MLVDSEAKKYTYLEADIKKGDGWIALKGCQMGLDNMSVEDLVDWKQNEYTATF